MKPRSYEGQWNLTDHRDRSKSDVPRACCAAEILTPESQQNLFNNSERKLKQQGQKLEVQLDGGKR